MQEVILQYLIVFFGSAFKIVFGMVLGTAFNLGLFWTATTTVLGMMAAIYMITFFGPAIRRLVQKIVRKRKKKIFTKNTRRNVRIWQKYGVPGIAFLTPIILMPIGGAFIANAFGGKKSEILKWMWIACIFWTYPLTWVVMFAGDLLPFGNEVLDSLSGIIDFI